MPCLLTRLSGLLPVALVLFLSATPAPSPAQLYESPREAATAFALSVVDGDTTGLRRVLGGDQADVLSSGDARKDHQDFLRLKAAVKARVSLDQGETTAVLILGPDSWPFPVPLILDQGKWRFDPLAGVEELRNRLIGKNELATIRVLAQYPAAQDQYEAQDRNGDGVREYATRFLSTPGQRDGLYWETLPGETPSPLEEVVAEVLQSGIAVPEGEAIAGETQIAYQGYLFRILTRQGAQAPGKAMPYVVNGHMVSGHAVVAWPEVYGETGIMTFLVAKDGRILQKDLGPDTVRSARRLRSYNPDATWQEVDRLGR